MSEFDRFWRQVHKQEGDGCWEWTGTLTGSGYGQINVGYRMWRAHRLAYEREIGPIPDGHHIHHTCGNRRCVRVSHLEALPQGEHRERPHRRTGPPVKGTLTRLGDNHWRLRVFTGQRRANGSPILASKNVRCGQEDVMAELAAFVVSVRGEG